MATATDTTTVRIRRAATVAKARALIDLGQQSAAAALVPTSAVSTSYRYRFTFVQATGDNGIWSFNTNQGRYTVQDSNDVITGVIKNALPFISANDPRVPVVDAKKKGFDGQTNLYTIALWGSRGDEVPLVSGIDARLIEAEAKLQANDIAGMMTILNVLRTDRTSSLTIGTRAIPAMPALAVPATQDAAVTLFFREKAFWTFGRGQRLGDMRRLIRQYKRTEDQVFPTGLFFKNGSYGHDVNLPVLDSEKTNPNFKGCIDRNA